MSLPVLSMAWQCQVLFAEVARAAEPPRGQEHKEVCRHVMRLPVACVAINWGIDYVSRSSVRANTLPT